jgi:carbon-monoxide dehydrogenase small subunit
MTKRSHISLSVNGDEYETLCEPDQSLVDVLRNELELTGTKEGCSTGDCGACSIRLDGDLVCSCLVLAVEAEGTEIETIEGMAPKSDELHPLQRHFLEINGLQCGICTPGILIAAKALLEKNSDPTETEIRFWLAGNLCRCTGYDKIIRSVQAAAEEMRKG